MTIAELKQRAAIRRRFLDAEKGKLSGLEARLHSVQQEVQELTEEVTDLEQVGILLNSIGEDRQVRAQQVIEELVTRGLQTIFDESLSFHIVQSVKGKTASVEFYVRTHLPNKTVIDTPVMEARGGGLAATIGFLLRVVVLLLRNGASSENILVLDESFAHVSAEYLDSVGEFLRELVEKTGIQIILVTHQQELVEYGDAVYKFSQVDGDTVVERV